MALKALPRSSKVLLCALFAFTTIIFILKVNIYRFVVDDTLTFHDILVPFVQLIPRYTLFHPWVLVTAIFAEISVFPFILSTLVLYTSTKYVEKFWGYKEVIKFVILIGSITNLWTVLVTILCNIFREDVEGMDKPLGGGISYYFGFLVVLKQLIPEHNILLFNGMVNFRVKQFPFILLLVVLAISLIMGTLYPFLPSIGSFVVSFLYLRFYQTFTIDPLLPITTLDGIEEGSASASSGSVITGDASDTFQLVEFFPSITKPYLGYVFDKIYELGVFLGAVTPFNDELIEQGNMRVRKRQEQTNQVLKSVANSVAERRRQVALQVIEERISKESKK
ncbi:DUF1751-domain-containing protein [Suhomyces tanzawaensis NRRL Y-17324]|uniref:DUF1751-domain-containing protein n=1 Tax=Suhomyces tanzawaensis NRRL Y-17324 TaxID=984487 RepID=A0A1E4SD26_9ASCO|nr:DUF1751-domain-containing protein [Suhomyces tanzawaensis NRRL Y-17324]ODV77419.1 DUF1751-domain-containing protein [Suhomyces tanzawaensis NRRL Y-17324]